MVSVKRREGKEIKRERETLMSPALRNVARSGKGEEEEEVEEEEDTEEEEMEGAGLEEC